MRTVHKFRLETGSKGNCINLREGFRILHSEYLVTEKSVFVWIEVPLDITLPEHPVQLRVFHTGDPIPAHYEHLATAVDAFGPEAFHIYALETETVALQEIA